MSDSEDDWFNKDEDDIVESLQQQVKQQEAKEAPEEHIKFCSAFDDHVRQLSLASSSSSNAPPAADRFTTSDFAKALKMTPLEMFLYFMSENRDLFGNQLAPNDSHKRFFQYVEILTKLCQLEMGGFDEQLLTGFARQTSLLDHVVNFANRIFAPSSKGNLDADSQAMLRGIKWLLLRAHKLGVLGKRGYKLIDHFKMLFKRCQLTELLAQPVFLEFIQELEVLPSVIQVKNEIYPTLEDLLRSAADPLEVSRPPAVARNAAAYINGQRRLLCEDFLQPLREFVQRLLNKTNIDDLEAQNLVWPHTQLVLNPKFAEAERHSLIFMDLRPRERLTKDMASKLQSDFLRNIKTGALLCFTSSYDFNNLILATVCYTEPEKLHQGYLSVEIVKQYNIGNLYEKPLIMFETPVFFEPYLRAHNYLSTCGADNFPMCRYIVEGQLEVRRPAYIKKNNMLKYCGESFRVETPPLATKLNVKQRAALGAALTNEFYLIQGPPGTGKTHLSVELINILVQNAAELKTGPIIVLTYTNDALDKFLVKVAQHTDSILRFGCQTGLRPIAQYNVRSMVDTKLAPARLKRVWWLVKCEFKEQFEHLQSLHVDFDGTDEAYKQIQTAQEQLQLIAEKINTLRTIFQYYVARDKSVLAMTTTCAARLNFLFRLLQSKCYVFEEAAETPEPHVLACLTPYAEHVMLIGDHKQLKPHTGNHTQQGLQVSLFERLITQGFPATVLNVQYRMRSCIAELLVPSFYDELINDDSVAAHTKVHGMATSLYFVNHNQPEEQLTDMSFINKHEAGKLIELALGLKHKSNDIVILSPYNGQVEYIRAELGRKCCSNIKVASVDSYQGLEANIVLLSLVRSNSTGHIGFLRQPNRVCVALSRARWALYIIGSMQTLQAGNAELWGAINSKLQAANAIGDEFPLTRGSSTNKAKTKK